MTSTASGTAYRRFSADVARCRQQPGWTPVPELDELARIVKQSLPDPVWFDEYAFEALDLGETHLTSIPHDKVVYCRPLPLLKVASAVRGLLTFGDIEEFTRAQATLLDPETWSGVLTAAGVPANDPRRAKTFMIVSYNEYVLAQHVLGLTPICRVVPHPAKAYPPAWPLGTRGNWRDRSPWTQPA